MRVVRCFTVDDGLVKKAEEIALKNGLTLSELIESLLYELLKRGH